MPLQTLSLWVGADQATVCAPSIADLPIYAIGAGVPATTCACLQPLECSCLGDKPLLYFLGCLNAKSFHKHYPDEHRSRVMQCGGHVAKNFQQQLEKAQKRKSVAPSMQKQFEKRSIETKHKNCCCTRNHKQACGCLTPAFVKKARINFHSSLVNAGTSPEAFSRIMKEVGSYHCRDVHEWENGGHCSFHKLRLCTCEKCGDGEVLCEGKPYHTKVPLTCEYHQLEFELECHKRADMAEALIHPVLGKGHTNLPESSHSILIRFRTKDVALGRLKLLQVQI